MGTWVRVLAAQARVARMRVTMMRMMVRRVVKTTTTTSRAPAPPTRTDAESSKHALNLVLSNLWHFAYRRASPGRGTIAGVMIAVLCKPTEAAGVTLAPYTDAEAFCRR